MNENLLFPMLVFPLTMIAVGIYYRIKNRSALKTPNGTPAYIDNQNGPVRIYIAITNTEKTPEGIEYTAISTHNSTFIGFKAILPFDDAPSHPVAQKLTLKSVGEASDRFLHLLAYLYDVSINTSARFPQSITLDCIDLSLLGKDKSAPPPESKQTSTWYKLFFHPDSEDEYAELYLNIHRKEGYIEIAEKDEEYRPQVIAALSH